MVTLEEAIQHVREVALSNSACGVAYRKGGQTMLADGCDACATEHEQLAKWLIELKQRREAETIAQSKNNAYYIKSDSVRNLTYEEAEALNKMNYSGAISTGDSLFEEIGKRPKTNADRIRQMADEELALEIRSSICEKVENCENDLDCYKCRLQWLKQEVSEDD